MISPGDEWVDVIDDDGRTIGVVRRREVREKRLPHRCVYLLVFDRDGRLFIHQRTMTKDVYPGYWDVAVGGVLAAGESFDDGVCREAQEELGVAVQVEPLFPFRYADERTVVQGYVYRAVHDGPFQLQPEEVVRGEFVTLTELAWRLKANVFCPDGRAVFAQFQEWMRGTE
jgi:isopentenyldiphosphate isomerase